MTPPPEQPDDYERQIARWREARERRLRSSDGWLTLVDRVVLDEGANELPPGTFTIRGGEARFRPAESPDAERLLRPEEGGPAETLWHEGRAYELFRRGDLFAVRVKDPASAARHAFRGLDFFPVDRRWRVVARFERFDPPRHTMHAYDIGGSWRRQVPGVARFSINGAELSLEPVLEEDSNRLFFVFGDLTNATETYPAGRFLYADPPPGTELVLDFNTAFNPPCAFTAYATCPITPPQNRLPVAIPAGERRYVDPLAS